MSERDACLKSRNTVSGRGPEDDSTAPCIKCYPHPWLEWVDAATPALAMERLSGRRFDACLSGRKLGGNRCHHFGQHSLYLDSIVPTHRNSTRGSGFKYMGVVVARGEGM